MVLNTDQCMNDVIVHPYLYKAHANCLTRSISAHQNVITFQLIKYGKPVPLRTHVDSTPTYQITVVLRQCSTRDHHK